MKLKKEKLTKEEGDIGEQIVASFELKYFDKAQQGKMISILTNTLASQIAMELWKKLPVEQKSKMLEDLDGLSDEQVAAYLDKNISGFSELAQKATKKLIADFKKKKSSLPAK